MVSYIITSFGSDATPLHYLGPDYVQLTSFIDHLLLAHLSISPNQISTVQIGLK